MWTPEEDYEPYRHYDWLYDKTECTLGTIWTSGEQIHKPGSAFENTALGAMFGAFIGDALGA